MGGGLYIVSGDTCFVGVPQRWWHISTYTNSSLVIC